MSLTFFVVWKSWASSPLRTALSIAGIALGVAIVVAIFVMDHNTIQTRFRLQNPEQADVDLELLAPKDQQVADTLQALVAVPGVAAVAVAASTRVQLLADDGRNADVELFGLWPLPAPQFGHYQLASGRDLTATDGEHTLLLGQEASRLLGNGAEQTLRLRQAAAGVRYVCRDGELVAVPHDGPEPAARSVEVAGLLAPLRLGHRNFGQVAVAPLPLVLALTPGAKARFQVRRAAGVDLDRLQQALRLLGYVVVDARQGLLGEAADERAFRNGIKILGCLALLLGMFVVFQTLSHSLVMRVRHLGLLRCLGAQRGAVARIFLGEALLLGVSGAVLGLLLGVALAWLLAKAQVSSLGMGKAWLVFELPLLPMLFTAGLGVLFTLAGALFPLWRARQLPALWILRQRGLGGRESHDGDLLRGVNLWMFVLLVLVLPVAYLGMTPLVAEAGRETLWVLLEMGGMLLAVGGLLLVAPAIVGLGGQLLLLPLRAWRSLPAWLCGKSLVRQRGRIAASVTGLAAVLLALLALETLTASLRGDVHVFASAALQGRAFVEVPVTTAAAVSRWRAVPGIASVEPIEGEISGPFLLRGLAAEHAAAAGGALEGNQDALRRYTDPRVRTLVASRRLALKMGWQPGDLVALRDRDDVPVSYEVLLVSDASGYVPSEQAWAVAAPHWLRTDFCLHGACVQNVVLRLQAGADGGIVGSRLRAAAPELRRYKTGDEIRGYHVFDVGRDFLLFELLLAAILVLAGGGLLNGMAIAALGRTREFGTLRALGVPHRALWRSLLLEGAITGGLAAALALLLAVPTGHVLVSGLNRVAALAVPVVWPMDWWLFVPVLGIGVGLLAAWLPARRAAAEAPASAVRYE